VKAQQKAHSYRFRGSVVRVASWHGRPDVASIAFRGTEHSLAPVIERLLDRLRRAGYREVLTNAVGPATSIELVDGGFVVRGRLHLLEHALETVDRPSRRTRRAGRVDREQIVDVDAAAFEEFWHFDELALAEAMRATPHRQTRVTEITAGEVAGYGLFGRSGMNGYVQRLAVAPAAQGRGLGRALLHDGLGWLREHGATRALVNTQEDNARAVDLYLSAGFTQMPVGLCVLGREL
jgi:ribosomal protein S18 acetylase RimI-like enzyme